MVADVVAKDAWRAALAQVVLTLRAGRAALLDLGLGAHEGDRNGLWRRGAVDTAVLQSLGAGGAGADETVVAERLDSRVADHLVLAAGDILTLRSIVGGRVAVLTHVAGLRSQRGWNHKGGAALADVVVARGAGRATQLSLDDCVTRRCGLSDRRR